MNNIRKIFYHWCRPEITQIHIPYTKLKYDVQAFVGNIVIKRLYLKVSDHKRLNSAMYNLFRQVCILDLEIIRIEP